MSPMKIMSSFVQTIGEKLFLKLLESLGSIIHKKYKESIVNEPSQLVNIATKIKFIIEELDTKCTTILLKGEHSYRRHHGNT